MHEKIVQIEFLLEFTVSRFFERNDCTLKLFRAAFKIRALQGRSRTHFLLLDTMPFRVISS